MAADPIIFCLQELTDYEQFERLCSDVVAGTNYRDIEPLGGRADRGRDALFISRTDSSDVTIFAYTVRQDWLRKLKEDCDSIRSNGHECRQVVFVCTSRLTANDKDSAKASVKKEYGWDLSIFDLERLRIGLVGPLRHLVPKHPQIFCPPWFPQRGGLSIAHGRDTLVIDHVVADHAFATWLARKLQLDGYPTWCFGTAPMAGESPDDTVRTLIENRAVRYLPILSAAAIANADLIGRCILAGNHDGLVLPCVVGTHDPERLGTRLKSILPIRFDSSWADGLRELIKSLEAHRISKRSDADRSKAIALGSFIPEPVTLQEPENLIASVFPVTAIPKTVIIYRAECIPAPDERFDALRIWPHVELSSGLFASFHFPGEALAAWRLKRTREPLWKHFDEIEGKRTSNLIKELLRRCLELACYRAGLVWCKDRRLLYFPAEDNPQRRVSYTNLDGEQTTVSVAGIRTYGTGERATTYHYQLAPVFRVGFDSEGSAWVTTRIYARVTASNGTPFTGKTIGKRRRHLAKSWWNQHWLARTLGVMQAIADESRRIVVGSEDRQVVVCADPMMWQCPVSIDESAVDRLGDFQEELAALQFVEDDENGENGSEHADE